MRILFVNQKPRSRYLWSVIRLLAERGHTVRLAYMPHSGHQRLPKKLHDPPRVTLIEGPWRRVDVWQDLVTPLRSARDYLRYLDARFRHAAKLRQRASFRAGKARVGFPGFIRLCESPLLRNRLGQRVLPWALRLVEAAIPSDRAFEDFIRAERPDVMLITPLVNLDEGSYQTDYVKSAHALGIPIAFLPFSWDNLTNKGLIRVIPDRVFVWNEIQRGEAIELHGVPEARVRVTGAWRFDDFFARTPQMTHEGFCSHVSLDPSHPVITYLCSSAFVAPREVEFVRQWVVELRRAQDPALRTCGVLIRPHPANQAQWRDVALSDLWNVALWDEAKHGMGRDQGLYECLYHSATVVGLNTSALLEAGILGKTVHTMLAPGFEGGQEGTIHFQYLLHANGGLALVARSFEEHHAQLSAAFTGGSARRERSLRFIEGFLRPHGLGEPASPRVVREVERLGTLEKRPRRAGSLWHYPVRWLVLLLAVAWGPRTRALVQSGLRASRGLGERKRGRNPGGGQPRTGPR